ncbi:MAG: Bro-N domain-containing protein [Puniceicoccales bacterium]|nr:Bro-N domain-containing protein [Puniceicoccales bacterium]
MNLVKHSEAPQFDPVFFEKMMLRRLWHDEQWYYSIIDVVEILTGSDNPRRYWSDLKAKMIRDEQYEQLYGKIVQLKLPASDEKSYLTDCTHTEGILRIIQSIPSKKAEPFKQWLAKIGHERLKEISDPALAVDRAREYWKKHGRSELWIQRRMMGQETRNKLTDYWKNHDVREGREYAILTNIIHEKWSGLTYHAGKNMRLSVKAFLCAVRAVMKMSDDFLEYERYEVDVNRRNSLFCREFRSPPSAAGRK